MPRRATYNKEGQIVMGAAAQHAKIFSLPELADRAGVPYITIYKDLKSHFCGDGFSRFKAMVRATGMTDEEIIQIVRGK